MRILVVSQYFYPENFRINDLAAGLVERGHQVTVLTGIPNYPGGSFFPGYGFWQKSREEYRGVKVVRVPVVPRGAGGGARLALNYFSFALTASLLAPFLCRDCFDVIFVCQLSPVTVGLPALLMKRLKRTPLIFWILDLWPESLSATGAVTSPRGLALVSRLVRFIYAGCDKIIIASKGFVSSLAAKGVEAERIDYFPNWYEPEYQTGDITPVGGLPAGFRLMFAGNIGVAQDFPTILTAAEKLKDYSDIHLVVLGDGRQYEWVKEQVALRGLSETVHLLGRHPPETMSAFFASADAMLVTLKQDPVFALTVPGKIQSYMACGRPIIAALDGEGRRLISESCAGFSVPSGDADALAEAVLKMYHLPREGREAMGRQGHGYCTANFERGMLIHRLECWMKELV